MTLENRHRTIEVGTKVLITGGGGFLGGAIARLLAARGAELTSFSRRRHGFLDALGVAQIQGDIADPGAVADACAGKALVFHSAAKPPPWGRYADYHRTNVTGTQNVLDACRRHGIEGLVHTSTPSVVFSGTDLEGVDESIPYPSRCMGHYPQTKALAERLVRRAADVDRLPAVILRPHDIWGPGDPHFVPRIIARAGRLKRIGSGRNLVDTTYIDNAAAAHVLAAERLLADKSLAGRVYFISQGEPVPAWEMIDAILDAAGLGPVKGAIPYPLAWTAGAVCEGVWRALRLRGEPPMTRFVANALATAHWFDIGAAKRDLGYFPEVSTEEGLRRLAEWLRSSQTKEDAE